MEQRIITPDNIRTWYTRSDSDWPSQDDRWFNALADACNRERARLDAEKDNARARQISRKLWSTARKANATLQKVLPPLIQKMTAWLDRKDQPLHRADLEDAQEGLQRLRDLYDATRKAKPPVAPIRKPAGQPRPYVTFACRVATHLIIGLQRRGVHDWSFNPDGPMTGFVTTIVEAVYARELGTETLSKGIKRDPEIKQYLPTPRQQRSKTSAKKQ